MLLLAAHELFFFAFQHHTPPQCPQEQASIATTTSRSGAPFCFLVFSIHVSYYSFFQQMFLTCSQAIELLLVVLVAAVIGQVKRKLPSSGRSEN